MNLGIGTFAFVTFGLSDALRGDSRVLARRWPRVLLITILLCPGLVAWAAQAEPVASEAQAPPQPASVGAPVLGQAENATVDVNSLNAEAPSPYSMAAPSLSINLKSARSDQNCLGLAKAAAAHDLPLDFFVRLIRQESNFDPNSVSHAGALGIAQFMPGTARWRGLADPFEPLQALDESARWLRELREQFGNLGLAAGPTTPARDACRTGSRAGEGCLAKHAPMSASSPEERLKNGRAARSRIAWVLSSG